MHPLLSKPRSSIESLANAAVVSFLDAAQRKRSGVYKHYDANFQAKIGRYTAEKGNKASLITISILKTLNLKPFNTYNLIKTLNITPAKKCSYTVGSKYSEVDADFMHINNLQSISVACSKNRYYAI